MALPKGYVVSGLTDYVEINKDALIRDVVLGFVEGDTIAKMGKQMGVKGSEVLNYLNVDPVLQNGKGCGFSPVGNTNFSERTVETHILKVNDEWCNDDLLGKYAEYLVKFGANKNAEEFGFEKEILDGIGRGINKKMEKIVWQGDTGLSITGLIELAEGADSASTIFTDAFSADTAMTIYDKVKAVIMEIPEEILDNAVVFVSPSNFRSLVFELLEKNNFHITPEEIEKGEFYFPATTIPIHKTYGLTGVDNKIYATTWGNMIYACDMMSDREEYRVWFSDDNDVHRLKIKFNMGVTTLFPDAVVLGE